MTPKKTAFGARPKPVVVDPAAADAFVSGGAEKPVAVPVEAKKAPEKMKRLTIDIEPALHKRLKARAAEEDTSIADVARRLLQEWAYR